MSASDQFERLIVDNQIAFNAAPVGRLTAWGQSIVKVFLDPAKISWRLGNVKVGRSYCLKLDDSFLQYLDVLEETSEFLWATDDHHDSVHPDDASAYLLMKSAPGVLVECLRDDISGLRRMTVTKDGRSIIVDDFRKTTR